MNLRELNIFLKFTQVKVAEHTLESKSVCSGSSDFKHIVYYLCRLTQKLFYLWASHLWTSMDVVKAIPKTEAYQLCQLPTNGMWYRVTFVSAIMLTYSPFSIMDRIIHILVTFVSHSVYYLVCLAYVYATQNDAQINWKNEEYYQFQPRRSPYSHVWWIAIY